MATFPSTDAWWEGALKDIDNPQRRRCSGVFIYIMWNAWKERNRHIFNGMILAYMEVAHLTFEEIAQHDLTFRPRVIQIHE